MKIALGILVALVALSVSANVVLWTDREKSENAISTFLRTCASVPPQQEFPWQFDDLAIRSETKKRYEETAAFSMSNVANRAAVARLRRACAEFSQDRISESFRSD